MSQQSVWAMFFIVVSVFLAAQPVQPHLKRLVGIAAEDGVVAIDGNMVSVFSVGNIRVQDAEQLQWKLAHKKGGAVSFRAEGTGWYEQRSALPISTAHSFAFCDPLNQVDLGSVNENLRSALPAEARVKSLIRVRSDLNLVVYSVSRKTVSYDVRVGLVQSKVAGGYSLVVDDLATDSGNFCGVQQGEEGLVFVFVDEPAGSSDFSAVYAYTIDGRSQGH